MLGVAVCYFLAARVGLQLALARGQVTPLWPPTGSALACLLVFGMRCWPGITIGALVANVFVGPTFPAVIAISAGNTTAPVCACLLLAKAGFRPDFARLKDVLALVFVAALGGMLISATIGTGTLAAVGALAPRDFWATWSVWWAGDAMGVLVIAPVLLAAITSERDAAQRAVQRAASQSSDAVLALEPYRLLNRGLFRTVGRGADDGPATTPPA